MREVGVWWWGKLLPKFEFLNFTSWPLISSSFLSPMYPAPTPSSQPQPHLWWPPQPGAVSRVVAYTECSDESDHCLHRFHKSPIYVIQPTWRCQNIAISPISGHMPLEPVVIYEWTLPKLSESQVAHINIVAWKELLSSRTFPLN